MEINLLGPLEVRSDGTPVVATARKPRQVLSLLATQAGDVVTTGSLIEELWSTRPPASATTTLQTYILQLRRALATAGGPPAKQRIETCYGGYMLRVEPGDVDVIRFDALVAAGHVALEQGDLETASATFHDALDMWRGDPLVDVAAGPLLAMEVTRLEEARLGTLEIRIETDLQLGRHAQVLAELTALTVRHPLNENLCGQLMVALHRCGRNGQALESFSRIRRTLVDELGIEPSGRLQHLQQSILRSDPHLRTPSARRIPETLAG